MFTVGEPLSLASAAAAAATVAVENRFSGSGSAK
jgi:hypothetical protein